MNIYADVVCGINGNKQDKIQKVFTKLRSKDLKRQSEKKIKKKKY